MASTLQETLLWNRTSQPPAGKRTLGSIFELYARGKRLDMKDLLDLATLLREGRLAYPLRIAYHEEATLEGPRKSLRTNFYYLSVPKRLSALDADQIRKINPYKTELSVVGESSEFSFRKTNTYVRALPVTLNNEILEHAYLSQTASMLPYADPRTEHMIGMTLLILQAQQNHYEADVAPDGTRIFIPYGDGLMSGRLENNKRIDTRPTAMVLKHGEPAFVPRSQNELRFSAYFNDYLARNRFTPAQETLYQSLQALFPLAEAGQFDRAMESYLQGETIPAEEDKSPALRCMEAFMETPEWINATQRTRVNGLLSHLPSFVPGSNSH